MTTRRVRILRALKPLLPGGAKLAVMGELLGEQKDAWQGVVWSQLNMMIKHGWVATDGERRRRVYRLTDSGVTYLDDLEAGRAHVIVRAPRKAANEKGERTVIWSAAKTGQAPLTPIASVFDLGRYL